ncbi:P27 family predicted phage terminase small subunit [Algoriphagus sp. 4150]|uniref:phage terminase small subunit P27 family n=1 Tax=Algoriphagus sp. 4150 TaxID=2817756 RepID=UPI00285821CF|nr:phage terminase small subunit P27 family [Algoriphagus sp. 4150]MDR7130700.1 P27 family predicted phage terminase small subunit [Algoriphagus sp. 4150]
MGRSRIADELKEKKGTLQKCRTNANKPQFNKVASLDDIKVPTHLNKYGKVFFKKFAQLLIESDVLTNSDFESLEILSAEYGKYLEAQFEIKRNGYVITGTNKNGATYQMISPWINIANNAFKNYSQLMSKFGLSPSERSKISVMVNDNKELSTTSIEDFLN